MTVVGNCVDKDKKLIQVSRGRHELVQGPTQGSLQRREFTRNDYKRATLVFIGSASMVHRYT